MNILATYWREVRGFNRDIWLLNAVWAMLAFGYFGIMGVLLNLYLLRLGYGPTFIGLLIASGQLLWALLALPAAAVGQRIGPRNSISAGHFLVALGVALMILVEGLPATWWSAWLVASWMLVWIGAALNTVNSIPYLMAISDEEERNYAFAVQSSAIAIFGFFGSLTAGALPALFAAWRGLSLDLPDPYRLGLWFAPALFVLSGLLILKARSVTLPRPANLSPEEGKRPNAMLAFLAVTTFLIAATEGSLYAFLNVYLDTALNIPTAGIGVILGVGRLLPAVAAMTAPALMAWMGAGGTFAFASFAAGLFMLPLTLIAHWFAAAVSFMGVIGATATAGPARSVFSQLAVSPQWRTAASAALTIGLGLGWAFMAAAGGVIIEQWGFSALFALAAVFGLVNALLLALYLRRQRSRTLAAVPLP